MVKQYVGARYVPKFADPVAWASGTSYEAMTIVTYNNSSYTSKVPVPATVGNPADNPDYWALTGNYNAQVEQYRQETIQFKNEITEDQNAFKSEVTEKLNKLHPNGWGTLESYGGGTSVDNANAYNSAIEDGVKTLILGKGTYKFSKLELGKMNIVGCGMYETIISPTDDNKSPNFITLAQGPNAYKYYANFAVVGNKVPGQNGISVVGTPQTASPNDGGLWYTTFENIFIYNFAGYQFYANNQNNFLLPNQFITYINCNFVSNTSGKSSYYGEGSAQQTFIGCRFASAPSGYYGLELIGGSTIQLSGCTVEYCDGGISFKNGTCIGIDTLYMEGVSNAVVCNDLGAYSSKFSAKNLYFTNTSGYTYNTMFTMFGRCNVNVNDIINKGTAYDTLVDITALSIANYGYFNIKNYTGIKPANITKGSGTTIAVSDNTLTIANGFVTVIKGGTFNNIVLSNTANSSYFDVPIYISVAASVSYTASNTIANSGTIAAGTTAKATYDLITGKWTIS